MNAYARTAALLLLALTGSLSADQAPAPPPPQVTGIVRDAVTGAPLANARVRIAAYNDEWCEPCTELYVGSGNVMTDSQGRFAFDYAADTFILEADQTGYATGAFGARRPLGRAARIDLKDGQQLRDVEILLFREAIVRGRLTDAGGKPMRDYPVDLMLVHSDGSSTFASRGGKSDPATRATTDAQGYYTVYAAPGRYTAVAFRDQIPTFHPSATNIREAKLFTLEPGEVRKNIDVRLRPNHAAVVQAHVALPPDSPLLKLGTRVRLRNDAIEIEGKHEAGNVEFTNVPYGTYTLTAEWMNGDLFDVLAGRPQTLNSWAQATVRVDQPRVGAIELVPQASIVVAGTVTTPDGQPGLLPGIQLRPAHEYDVPCGLFRWTGDIVKDRQFLLRTRPGQYRLCVWTAKGDGWEEATLNNRDIVDLPLQLTEDVRNIQVVVNPTRGRMRGTVHDSRDRPAREGWVVVFPADRSFWPHARKESGRFRSVRVSIAGAFEIQHLLPGQYLVASVDDESIDGWPNEAWIARTARRAEAVAIGEGNLGLVASLTVRSIPPGPASAPRASPSRVMLFDVMSLFSRGAIPDVTVDLDGTVRDSTGKPAVRAEVTLRRDGDVDAAVFTGLDGRYRFGGVTKGSYTITAEADVPFSDRPILVGSDQPLPMVVADIVEMDLELDRSRVIDLKTSLVRRPSFVGDWTLDEQNSSATSGQLTDDLGPPPATFSVSEFTDGIEWSRGLAFGGLRYRLHGAGEELTIAGRSVTAVTRWQGEHLVTRLTVPGSAERPVRTYEETRWLEKNRTMVVEVRGANGSVLRRSVYRFGPRIY